MKKLFSHQTGQGLVEYALILSLVAVVVIVILVVLGPQIGQVFSGVHIGLGGAQDSTDPPPDCYSTLLLPLMVGLMLFWVWFSNYLPHNNEETFELLA
jgi:pilus assembly protein Flp/PilA